MSTAPFGEGLAFGRRLGGAPVVFVLAVEVFAAGR